MSRYSAMNMSRHTDNAGAACSACASSFSMMIIAGIAFAMSVLRISVVVLSVLLVALYIMGIIILMSGNDRKRPEVMSQS